MRYEQPYTIYAQLSKVEDQLSLEINPALRRYLVRYEHNKAKHLARERDKERKENGISEE